MRELMPFLHALTYGVFAFLVVGILSCALLGGFGVPGYILAIIFGIAAAIAAGYLGACPGIRRMDKRVILSAAKNLVIRQTRPFASLRVTGKHDSWTGS